MPRKPTPRGPKRDIAQEHFTAGVRLIQRHPMFSPLYAHSGIVRREGNLCPADGWTVVTSDGYIHAHPSRVGEPEEWAYVFAHCLLHLGFGHMSERNTARAWNVACDWVVARFLADMKFGTPPDDIVCPPATAARTEQRLFEHFREQGIPPEATCLGTAGQHHADMIWRPEASSAYGRAVRWPQIFGTGLAAAVSSAVNVAGGREAFLGATTAKQSVAQRAHAWFISSYPLLGALASAFDIIEDPTICIRMEISVAAVDAMGREIYINPAAGLDQQECRFVMAHELLHVSLHHQARHAGRDPYLWNVACDFVINGWLIEMGLGEFPKVGGLYDPELKGLSAESIYDRSSRTSGAIGNLPRSAGSA